MLNILNDLLGVEAAQAKFEKTYSEFLGSLPKLMRARSLALYVETEGMTEQKYLIWALSKLCFDRFDDILLMCANGRGEGAMSLVRGMFEGLVNASYLFKHPELAPDFRDHLFFQIKKTWNVIEEQNGRKPSQEKLDTINKALSRHAGPDGRIPKKNDWTTVDFVSRAKQVGLGHRLVLAYFRTLETAHPSMLHVANQAQYQADGGMIPFGNAQTFNDDKIKEALIIAHNLAIDILDLQYRTFGGQKLRAAIGKCLPDIEATWLNKSGA